MCARKNQYLLIVQIAPKSTNSIKFGMDRYIDHVKSGISAGFKKLFITAWYLMIISSLGWKSKASYKLNDSSLILDCLMCPMIEEIVFRWLFFICFPKHDLINAFLFAILHEQKDIWLIGLRIINGLITCGNYHKNGLISSITAHSIFNSVLICLCKLKS